MRIVKKMLMIMFVNCAFDALAVEEQGTQNVRTLITRERLESNEVLFDNREYKALVYRFVERKDISEETDAYVLKELCSFRIKIPTDAEAFETTAIILEDRADFVWTILEHNSRLSTNTDAYDNIVKALNQFNEYVPKKLLGAMKTFRLAYIKACRYPIYELHKRIPGDEFCSFTNRIVTTCKLDPLEENEMFYEFRRRMLRFDGLKQGEPDRLPDMLPQPVNLSTVIFGPEKLQKKRSSGRFVDAVDAN